MKRCKKLTLKFALFLAMATLASCSKDSTEGGDTSSLPGTLYIDFATDGIQAYNFREGTLTKVVNTENGPGITGYDFTYGSGEICLSVATSRMADYYQDKQTFLLRSYDGSYVHIPSDNIPTTGNVFRFNYQYDGDDFYREADLRLSPNKRYLAVDCEYWENRGVLLFDVQTPKLITEFVLPTEQYKSQDTPVWTNANEMYSAVSGVLYKWNPAFGDRVQEVLKINNGNGGTYVTVNPQGTRIAFRYNKHIWVQNIDGSGLTQVTTSSPSGLTNVDGEYNPVFSPDGKYIALVGSPTVGRAWTDYDPLQPSMPFVSVTGGGYGYVFVIPDDNKLYNLEDKSSGFIHLKTDGWKGVPSYFSNMIWR
ncbi:MAG: hypothetical protein Q4C98_07990 [Capnocytophaga sp.]|nr:hypothetical protein [Capnocytophaga sp.]